MRVFLTICSSLILFLAVTENSVLAQSGAVNADPDFTNYSGDSGGTWIRFKISSVWPNIWRTDKGGEGGPKGSGDGGPALWIYRNTPFDGGVYQVVPVTPGHGYHFQVGWAAVRYSGGNVSADIGKLARQVGIDPYGGTDPTASTVQWSAEHRDASHWDVPGLQMDQHARNSKITIFLRAKSEFTDGTAEVFFDHAILTENPSMGVITVAPPTPTVAPATATRTAAPTQVRTRVAQAPSATTTAQPSPSSTATAIPTNTSPPTATRTRPPTVAPEETNNNSSDGMPLVNILIAVGTFGAAGIGLLVFGFVIFHLLGRTT